MFGSSNNSPLPSLRTIGSPVQFTGQCSSKDIVEICQFSLPEATDAMITVLLKFKARMKVFNGSTVWVDKQYFSIVNMDKAPRGVYFENGPDGKGAAYEITSGRNTYNNYLKINIYRPTNTEFTIKALCYCYASGNMTGNIIGDLSVTGTAELIEPYSSGVVYTSNYISINSDLIPV